MSDNNTRDALIAYVKAWQVAKDFDRLQRAAWDNVVAVGKEIPYGTDEFVALTLEGKTYVIQIDVDDWTHHVVQEISNTYQGEE